MKKLLTTFLVLTSIVLLSACKPTTGNDDNVIYVTVYPMEYLVSEIGGDTVTVKRVPGSSTHSESIDWSAKEIIDMIGADIIFYVDGGVDTYIPNNEETVFNDGDVELINVSDYVTYNQVCYTHDHDHSEEEHEGEDHTEEPLVDPISTCEANMLSDDPHFWLDPVKMLKAAEMVKDKLIVQYPENSEVYENNFTVLEAALEKLQEDYQAMADVATKPIITTSMLFTYWHERYDIEILSLSTDVHTTETIPSDIIEFVEEAEYHELNYICFEKNANSPAGDQVLEQLQLSNPDAARADLHGLGNLTNEEIEDGETYLTIMYQNLEVLNKATK